LLAASTRAIADGRGPTEAELSFVEDLATTRARQGVPIHAVLSAIHVAERRIWARAREVAVDTGVDPLLLLEARELYDDWAQEVRGRLMAAHAAAARTPAGAGDVDREADLVRRLLQGGSAAAMAAASAALPRDRVLVVAAPASGAPAADLVRALRATRLGVAATDGPDVVAVLRDAPGPTGAGVLGLAGPGRAEDVPVLRRLATAAARVGGERGLSGVVPVASVASAVAMLERPDLGGVLLQAHADSLAGLGRQAGLVLRTVRAWLECSGDADAAAAREFVHPNTVRNRVAALAEATGLDPHDPLVAGDLWWLCRGWEEV
ncbi:MAG: helix-turn-helix domain-containing protein, partial [Nocardioides sp.]|nr:helix-turn-helix domain-containing protein [Nocardioides sp.]